MIGPNTLRSSSRILLQFKDMDRSAVTERSSASQVPPASEVPTVAEAERIAALTDPVMRNLLITQSYNELGRGLAARLGKDATWCALAVWASKQAGQTIRHEDPERVLPSYVTPELAEVIERLVEALDGTSWGRDRLEVRRVIYRTLGIRDLLTRAGDAIAEGNRKVFAEIGVGMARFTATLAADSVYDEERIGRFCDTFLPGPPPAGQGLLRRALRSYYRALFETDAKRRAELVLLANLDIGVHEQTNLQAEIQAALDAPVPDARELRRKLLAELHPGLGPLRPLLELYLRVTRPLDRLWRRAVDLARKVAHRALTELVLRLYLPTGEVLRLGRDLRVDFPPDLESLDDPVLQEVVASIDPDPASSRGTGTDDWADFDQRMPFIADYFRAYQQSPRIFDPPFSRSQVRQIKAGRRPPGWL